MPPISTGWVHSRAIWCATLTACCALGCGNEAPVADAAVGADALGPATDTASFTDTATSADTASAAPDTADAMATDIPAASFPAAKEVFDPGGIHTIALTTGAAGWQDLLATAADPKLPRVWHMADVAIDGVTYTTIGFRTFGEGSMAENPKKPNIRIGFDAINAKAEGPEGLHGLRLKASGADATWLREPLAYRMLSAAGAVGKRFGWARLTVNGEPYGFYQLVEQVDKQLFWRIFGNKDGNKYGAENTCGGLSCAKPDCSDASKRFSASPGDYSDLNALSLLIKNAAAADLEASLAKAVDLEGLLAVYAIEALISDPDGMVGAGTNFDLYHDTKGNRLVVIRGGADDAFGKIRNLWQPWGPPGACPTHVDALFVRMRDEVPALRAQMRAKMRTLQCGIFAKSAVLAWTKQLKPLIAAEVAADPKTQFTVGGLPDAFKELETFVVERNLEMGASAEFGACPAPP